MSQGFFAPWEELLAGDRRDVGRDRLGVLAGDDVGGHRAAAEAAVLDRRRDQRLVGLDLIEVRADLAGRAGVGERVAGAAVLLEDLLALRNGGGVAAAAPALAAAAAA